MKKIFFTLVAMFAAISVANAQTAGGFEGPGAAQNPAATVAEALTLNDDAGVVLTGKIINSLGDEKYTFKDETGEIIIEIDDEDWNGVKVTPEDTLVIIGEVDKDLNEPTTIDVKSFTVKPAM